VHALGAGALFSIAEGHGDFGKWFTAALGLWALIVSTVVGLRSL
jgi:hypothetical protein